MSDKYLPPSFRVFLGRLNHLQRVYNRECRFARRREPGKLNALERRLKAARQFDETMPIAPL